jgi:hypothetical protein
MALTAGALVGLSDYHDGIVLHLAAVQLRDPMKRHATVVFPRDQPRPRGPVLAALVDVFVHERKFRVEVKDDETRLEFDWSHIKTKEGAPRPRFVPPPPQPSKPEPEDDEEDASVCDYDDCLAAPEHESGPARFCEEHRCKSCPAGVIHKMQNRGQTLCYACANKKTQANLCSYGGKPQCTNPGIHHVLKGVRTGEGYFCEAHRCKKCPAGSPPHKMSAAMGDGTLCQACYKGRPAKRPREEKEKEKESSVAVSAEEVSVAFDDEEEDEEPPAKRPRVNS